MCIFHPQLIQSLWSGYHWQYVFLLQNLSISNANLTRRWWCQKWNKGDSLSRLVAGSMGINGFKSKHDFAAWFLLKAWFRHHSIIISLPHIPRQSLSLSSNLPSSTTEGGGVNDQPHKPKGHIKNIDTYLQQTHLFRTKVISKNVTANPHILKKGWRPA